MRPAGNPDNEQGIFAHDFGCTHVPCECAGTLPDSGSDQ